MDKKNETEFTTPTIKKEEDQEDIPRKNLQIHNIIQKHLRGKPTPIAYNANKCWQIADRGMSKEKIYVIKHLFNIVELSYTNDPSCQFYWLDTEKEYMGGPSASLHITPIPQWKVSSFPNIANHPEFKDLAKKNFVRKVNILKPELFYKDIINAGLSGRDVIDFVITDGGIPKDKMIIECNKARFLPLKEDIFGLAETQRYNNHSIEIANPSTAKTQTAETCGFRVISGLVNQAFLLGAYENDYKIFRAGALNGEGSLVLDEFSMGDEPETVAKVLNVIENGIERRGVKGNITCRGTVTLTLSGNAKFKDFDKIENILPIGFEAFISPILINCPDPKAVGRRFGIIMYDYKLKEITQIKWNNVYNAWTFLLRDLMYETIRKKYDLIRKIIRRNRNWLEESDTEYISELDTLIDDVVYPLSKEFLKGLTMNEFKLRMATLRKLIVENLDTFGS